MAYQDEKPVFVASDVPITNWTQNQDGSYRTSVPVNSRFYSLNENGKRAIPARYPDNNYNKAASGSLSRNAFYVNNGDILTVASYDNLETVLWAGGDLGIWNWFEDIINVVSIDKSSAPYKVNLKSNASYNIGGGSRYYMQGAREFLNCPGEFYINRSLGYMDYIPYNSVIQGSIITISSNDHIFKFFGSGENNLVQNIVIKGLEMMGTDRGKSGVYIENGSNITVDSCKIHDVGDMGILAQQNVKNCVFSSNQIFNVGQNGICMRYYANGTDVKNGYCEIVNNHIYNVGQIYGHGSCIQVKDSAGNHIANNLLHDSRRYAIDLVVANIPSNIIGTTINGVLVTESNVRLFTHTQGNVIEYNDIYRCITDSQDTAPIYAWGADEGNIIQYNYIHDCEVPFTYCAAVYLDDESDYQTVRGNVIYNFSSGSAGSLVSLIIVKGKGNTIENNIISNNKFSSLDKVIYNVASPATQSFNRNIAYNSGNTIYYLYAWKASGFASSDNSIFYDESCGNDPNLYFIKGQWSGSFAAWKRTTEFDTHSVTVNPGFMNASIADYRLQNNSPAYTAGVCDMDLQDIGLRADFPFADSEEVKSPKRLYIRLKGQSVNSGSVILQSGKIVDVELLARSLTGYVCNNMAGSAISYQSADSSIAQVSSAGKIIALKGGTTTITAKIKTGLSEVSTDLQVVVEDSAYVVFSNVSCRFVDDLSGLNEVNANIHLSPYFTEGNPVTVIITQYTQNNQLTQLNLHTMKAGIYDEIININNITTGKGGKMKVIVLKDINTMTPILKYPGEIIYKQ